MKNCYFDKEHQAIADLCDGEEMGFRPKSMIITRISVPAKFRGLGIGRKLLKQITDDADRDGISLYLEINPYGDLTYDDLVKWYERHGFVEIITGVWKRSN